MKTVPSGYIGRYENMVKLFRIMSLKKLLMKLPLESRKMASENTSLLMSESGDSLAFCVFARTIRDMFDGDQQEGHREVKPTLNA